MARRRHTSGGRPARELRAQADACTLDAKSTVHGQAARMSKGGRALFVAIGLAVVGAIAVVAYALNERPPETAAADGLLPAPTLGADGLFDEGWYRPTTGDLARDAALAASEGKMLAIFWELDGCEFCAAMHNEALRMPALHAYVSDRFYVVQLDYQGDAVIQDFDGVTASEREIARRHSARGTPTLEFRTADGTVALRIAGYPGASVLQSAFEFVDTGAFRDGNINDWLAARGL
jgi:thioredoxin-related protein